MEINGNIKKKHGVIIFQNVMKDSYVLILVRMYLYQWVFPIQLSDSRYRLWTTNKVVGRRHGVTTTRVLRISDPGVLSKVV